jgi:hypothetical protein
VECEVRSYFRNPGTGDGEWPGLGDNRRSDSGSTEREGGSVWTMWSGRGLWKMTEGLAEYVELNEFVLQLAMNIFYLKNLAF